MALAHRSLHHQGRGAAAPSPLDLRESRGELAEQACSQAPHSSFPRNWNNAVSQELALLFGVNNVHLMSRIKEAELRAKRFGDLAWVGCDVWCLWRYGNKHLH